MKAKLSLLAAIAALGLTTAAHASLLVYEPFNYPVTNLLVGQNGGLGFSGGWSANNPAAGTTGDGGAVYDETTTNRNTLAPSAEATALTWDGKVNNLPTLPMVGARYQGAKTNNSNVNIYRTLSSSAGSMAAGNGGVLWMSAAYHLVHRGSLGAGINLGLGNGYVNNRGLAFVPVSTSFIGVVGTTTNAAAGFNYRLNAMVTPNGWTVGQYSLKAGTNALPLPTTNDLIVVMKFTFGASQDSVEAAVFTENDTLSEAAFYASTNYVAATNSIDESTLTTLTLAQGRIANAQDEIRIGTSFTDVITLPPAGPVDIAVSTVTASPTNVFANGVATSTITVTLLDSLGIGVTNKSVTLAGDLGATITPGGAQTTDANGKAVFTVKSTTAGLETFTATDTTDSLIISQTASVLFTAPTGDASTSTVVASPTNVLANGTATSAITVTVKNSGGLPIAGKSVTLGASPGNALLSPVGAQMTDANGQVIYTASSTTTGTEVFTATNTTDAVVITQTASVEFSPTNASAAVSTVVAAPPAVYANGTATSTITVTLKSATGLPLAGKSVTLAGSPGTATILPAGAQTTDTNGMVIFTVSSSTPGAVVFTATDATDAVMVTQTATVDFVALDAPVAFNVNYYKFTPAPVGTPENTATLVGPAGGLGETWNQFAAVTGTNLVATNGLITGVSFSATATEGRNWGNPSLRMLQSGLSHFGKGIDTTLTITNLTPGAYYNVWLTSHADNTTAAERASGVWSTTNTTASPSAQAIDGRTIHNGTNWQAGVNYVRFEYVVADANGAIVFLGDATDTNELDVSDYRLPLNGWQLQQTKPPTLTIVPTPGNPGKVNLSWNSKAGKVYELVSTNDLTVPLSQWPAWNGLTNIAATPPSNTLTNIPGGDTYRFFALIERDAPPPPPLLSEDFEADNGGFFTVGSPNDWAWGAPQSDSGFGFTLSSGNGGSAKCWGTVLGTGGTPSGLITPGADSILQSPPIDCTGVTTAQLAFAAARDASGGDTIQVLIREVGTDNLLGTLTPIALGTGGWANIGPLDISVAAGKNAYLQFRFVGADGTYCGLYIDDVVVTGN